MSFKQQIPKFIELKEKWTGKERKEAIYMINIGTEDYLNFAKSHPNANINEQDAHVLNVSRNFDSSSISVYNLT